MYMASVTSQFLWLDDCIGYVELLCTLGDFMCVVLLPFGFCDTLNGLMKENKCITFFMPCNYINFC